MTVLSVVPANAHIAFFGADSELAFAALAVAQNADIFHAHIAAVFHVHGEFPAVFHDDIFQAGVALVDFKVNTAVLGNTGVMEIDVGLKQRLCVGFAAVSTGSRNAANDLDIAGIAAEGLEDDRILFLKDIAVIGSNDFKVVGDHIGVTVRDNIVVIVEAGVLAAEDNGNRLTLKGFFHHHFRGIFRGEQQDGFRGLKNARFSVGGVPSTVRQENHGCVALLQHIHVNLAAGIGDCADRGAVEAILHGVVGIHELQGVLEIAVIQRIHFTQVQFYQSAACLCEVIAVEVHTVGFGCGVVIPDAVWRHVDVGCRLMNQELCSLGQKQLSRGTIGFAVDLICRAQIAALFVEPNHAIGSPDRNDVSVFIQIQDTALGQSAVVTVGQDDPGVLVDHAVAGSLLLGKIEGNRSGRERHIGYVHAIVACRGNRHRTNGIVVVREELVTVFLHDLRKSIAVCHQVIIALCMGEAVSVGIHIHILSVFHGLRFACRGVDPVTVLIVNQLGLVIIELSVCIHEANRLQRIQIAIGLVFRIRILFCKSIRVLQYLQHFLVFFIHSVAPEILRFVVVQRIHVLELKSFVHGMAEDVRSLLHLGTVHQSGFCQVIVYLAVFFVSVGNVDIIVRAILEGHSLIQREEDALIVRHVVHEQIAAFNFLVAAVEFIAGDQPRSLRGIRKVEFGDLVFGAIRLHPEIFIGQLIIPRIVPRIDGAFFHCYIGIQGRNIRYLESKITILNGSNLTVLADLDVTASLAEDIFRKFYALRLGHRFCSTQSIRSRGAFRRGIQFLIHQRAGQRGNGRYILGIGARRGNRCINNDIVFEQADVLRSSRDLNLPILGEDCLYRLRNLKSNTGNRIICGNCGIRRPVIQCKLRSLLGFLCSLDRGDGCCAANFLESYVIKIACVATIIVGSKLHHMVYGSACFDLFQEVQIIFPVDGADFGILSLSRLRVDESILQVDVGAVRQGPRQLIFITGQIDCTTGCADVHGHRTGSKINDLGHPVAVHVGDALHFTAIQLERYITKVIVDALGTAFRALNGAACIYTEHQVIGQQIESVTISLIQQVVRHVQVSILIPVNDGSVRRKDIIGFLSVLILDDGVLRHGANVNQIVAGTRLGDIQIRIVHEFCYDLAGSVNDQIHIAVAREHITQGQSGVSHSNLASVLLGGTDQHMSDLAIDVRVRCHGHIGIPLRLIPEAFMVDCRQFRDVHLESVILGTDGMRASDNEVVCPDPCTGCGGQGAAGDLLTLFQSVQIHTDGYDTLRHILVKSYCTVVACKSHITALMRQDGKLGDFVSIGGCQTGIGAGNTQQRSGLLAIIHRNRIQDQIHAGAVANDHVGQEAAVVYGNIDLGGHIKEFLVILRGGAVRILGFRGKASPVIIVQLVQVDRAVRYAAGRLDITVQTGIMDDSVFIDVHEAACRAAAQMEPSSQVHAAFYLQVQQCLGDFAAVILEAEGENLHNPFGRRVRLRGGGAGHHVVVEHRGGACQEGYFFSGNIRVFLNNNLVPGVIVVKPHMGDGGGGAGRAGNVGLRTGFVIHFRGLHRHIQLVNAAKERVADFDGLAVDHIPDPGNRSGFRAGGNGFGLRMDHELLDNIGHNGGHAAIDVRLLIGSRRIFAQGDIRSGVDIGDCLAAVAALKAYHVTIGIGFGLGRIQGLDGQIAEQSGDPRALHHIDGSRAGLRHVSLGAAARKDKAAAVHIQVGIHVGLGAVAAENAQVPVAGRQSGLLADGDVLGAGPFQVDGCFALLAKRYAGGVDNAVEVHIGVGLQGDIVSGLRVRVGANGHGTFLRDLHLDLVLAVGNAADAGTVQPGVGFHLVFCFNKKIVARKHLAVQICAGGLFIHRVVEFISANLRQSESG